MIVFIILGAVSAAIMLLYGVRDLTSSARQRRRALAAAESLARPGDDGTWLDKFEDRVVATRPGRWLRRELELGGVKQRLGVVVLGTAVLTVLASYLVWILLAPTLVFVGLIIGVLGVRMFLRRAQQRRREAFVSQLPELARVLANASYAGLSLPTAIAVAASELAEPASSELGFVSNRLNFGAPLTTALAELQERVGSRETTVLTATLLVSSRSGGSLVTALRDIADTLEQRKETRREIQSILAQPIATSYTVVGMGIGLLLLLNIMKPGTVDAMTRDIVGQIGLVLSTLIFGGGFLLIRRITRFDL